MAFAGTLMASAACSDAPLAPEEKIGQADVEHLMPAVVDAHDRLAPRIDNPSVRERVRYDLEQLRIALEAGDARTVRFHTVVTADVLTQYVTGAGVSATDGADVDGIRLMLYAVSRVVHAGVDLGGV